MASVVETVTGTTMAELLAARDRATEADIVELRLDGVRDVNVAAALARRARPAIVTCRPVWEGGLFDGSEDERLNLLSQSVACGAEYVDVEWKARRLALPKDSKTRLVISHHDFEGVPEDLAARVHAMRATGADVVKVAVSARTLTDCLKLRAAMAGDHAHVAIAMGVAGQVTRAWPGRFGSCWTYGGSSAPGQIAARQLIEVFRVRETTSNSIAYGITGAPLGHSASPAMHNAALAGLGLDAVFVPLETADAADLIEVAEALGVVGVSVTAPLKSSFFHLAKADASSRGLGAINTLRRGPNGWEARNFDVAGFLAPLEQRAARLRGRRAVVLGAGGAARAAIAALKAKDIPVAVSARRADRARALAIALNVDVAPFPPAPDWDLLVNTTPAGTWPHVNESPIGRDALRGLAGKVVFDLVYNPQETTLMRWAREAGAEVIGGLEMLVAQADLQFQWWTGQRAPDRVMAEAARTFVRSHETHDV